VLVWVAWMSRYGEPSPTHAYAVGVCSSPEEARALGEAEARARGVKYVFQHCPASLDMQKLEGSRDTAQMLAQVDVQISRPASGRRVFVASGEAHGRVHFLGVFSSTEGASRMGGVLYPGWSVQTQAFVVDGSRSSASS